MNEKVKNVINKIIGVIVVIFIIFAVLVTIMAFSTINNKDGVPAIGGIALLNVQTDSMSPTFKPGDLILGKKLKDADIKALKEGDVITFFADIEGNGEMALNSHRIVEKVENGDLTYFITKGDKFAVEDTNEVYMSEVKCKWTGIRLPGMGAFIDFLKTPTGFLVCIVLPLALFFIYELVRFVMTIMKIKAEKAGNAVSSEITALEEEEIKRKAVEEYIKKQAEEAAQKAETTEENNN